MIEQLTEPLTAIVTYIATALLRWVAPNFWRDLDKRQFRLGVVALVATGVAVATGIAQGLTWAAIAKLALAALAGSVLIRQATKADPLVYDHKTLGRSASIRTKL